jgi:membrane peptidoglycan carboxypeptidase
VQTGSRGKRVLKRILTWSLILGLVGLLLGVGAFAVGYTQTEIPDPNKDFETQTTRIYYADGKTELGMFAKQNRESIVLDEMPQTIKDAVIAAENRTFWTDRGIDPKSIVRAAFRNAQGDQLQGASTITQQYVKILYLTQERTLQRKVKEAFLSLKLQRERTKRQILEGYLNTIYFGRGAYGIEAAAQTFFDKPAKRLNLRESAVLASVINNPTRFDPANGAENELALKSRYDFVLDGMATMGTISDVDAEVAKRKLPKFPRIRSVSQYGGQKGHMLRLVRNELLQLGYAEDEIDGGGLRITTTFTPAAMAAAAGGVAAQRPDGFGKNLHVAVASVEPGTGALRGFYGGHDFLESEINWASAGGMAGSTFKAFAVATAIQEGYSLKDTFDGNSPYELADGTDVENQGNRSYGSRISMLQATQNSVNTAFIDMTLGMQLGPEKIIETAAAMGIPGNRAGRFGIPRASVDLQPVTGVALGSAQVSPINMANAYATIANQGEAAGVHVVQRVVERSGEETYRHKVSTSPALDQDIAADVSYALQQVVRSGSGTAALSLGRPAAGKTGTATNGKGEVSSSWFVGYTPQMSTAVMYVRGKGREQLEGYLPEYFGGSYPARTWTDVMGRMMDGLPVESFPPPANVDGEAPSAGHAPAPPKPTRKPKPTKTPKPEPTQAPAPTPTPSPTPTPEPTPPVPTPSGSPSPTEPVVPRRLDGSLPGRSRD